MRKSDSLGRPVGRVARTHWRLTDGEGEEAADMAAFIMNRTRPAMEWAKDAGGRVFLFPKTASAWSGRLCLTRACGHASRNNAEILLASSGGRYGIGD